MNFIEFKDMLKKTVEEVLKEPAGQKLKQIFKEDFIPFLTGEANRFVDKFFPQFKEDIQDAIYFTIRDELKRDLVPDFNNKKLKEWSTKFADSVLDKTLPKAIDKAKTRFLTEELVYRLIAELFKKL